MGDNHLVPGTFVRLKTDPTRAGILEAGEKVSSGRRMVQVQFADGTQHWFPDSAIEAVPASGPSLSQRFADGRFADPEWLRRTLARIRVTGRLSDMVYSMEATETDFYAFQFKPILKLLNSPTDGLLIADEVGLGKTIEAGLIWTELRARFESNRLLVLCPKTLCEKWRSELLKRFGVDARIVNAADLLHIMSSVRGSDRGFAAIASMQSLRPPKGWDQIDDLNNGTHRSARQRLAEFLDEEAQSQPLLDLLVIDEAHHMRNPETLLHKVAQLCNEVASHRVFLSATPIHLRNRDLHSLLRLIDPDTFEFEKTLDDLITVNQPIIEARDLLLKPSASAQSVRACLDRAGQHEFLAKSKTLSLIRQELEDATLGRYQRAEFAARLEQVNQLANYVTRTRRRDVQEFRVIRDPKAPVLQMHPDERAFYDAVTEEVRELALTQVVGEGFLLATSQRLLSSSPAAASAYWEAHADTMAEALEDNDDDLLSDMEDERPLVSRLSLLSRRLGLSNRLAQVDTKYSLLKYELDHLWLDDSNAKVIVFSSFKSTLHYLKKRLSNDGIANELLHGSIKEPRDTVLNRFREAQNRTVLLSSEIGSEGVDLQFCWVVVNYDLPWNPMRLEQRIGRVDRLGQKKEKVVIINLIYADTIDDKIYRRLYLRLGLGERALGEFEAVLGAPIREMTRKLLDPTLSEQEKLETIEQTAQAVENLKKTEEELEADAGSLMQHGDYILQTITESRNLHRWLDGSDILTYVKDRLQRSFSEFVIEASPPGSDTYRIFLPTAAHEQFLLFMARRGVKGTTRLLNNNDQQRYIFTSSVVASSTGKEENVSQLHPLVRFAAELDLQDESAAQVEPVAVAIRTNDISTPFGTGVYVVAIQRWTTKTIAKSASNMAKLAFAGTFCDGDRDLSPDEAEALTIASTEHGTTIVNIKNDDRLEKASGFIEHRLMPELHKRFDDFVDQIRAQIEDRATIRQQALLRHQEDKVQKLKAEIDKRLAGVQKYLRDGMEAKARHAKSMAEATKGKIYKLNQSIAQRLAEIVAQRELTPEFTDVSILFVDVRK